MKSTIDNLPPQAGPSQGQAEHRDFRLGLRTETGVGSRGSKTHTQMLGMQMSSAAQVPTSGDEESHSLGSCGRHTVCGSSGSQDVGTILPLTSDVGVF